VVRGSSLWRDDTSQRRLRNISAGFTRVRRCAQGIGTLNRRRLLTPLVSSACGDIIYTPKARFLLNHLKARAFHRNGRSAIVRIHGSTGNCTWTAESGSAVPANVDGYLRVRPRVDRVDIKELIRYNKTIVRRGFTNPLQTNRSNRTLFP
jgi:hypothetical protein